MSLGLAYANAWLAADMAYSKKKAKEEFQQLQDEFEELTEDFQMSQKSDSTGRSLTKLVGGVIGFATGGFKGAKTGYDTAGTVYDVIDPYQSTLEQKQEAISDFKWELENDDSIKYGKIVDDMDYKIKSAEKMQDTYESAIGDYMDATYAPWWHDIAEGAISYGTTQMNAPMYNAAQGEAMSSWNAFQEWYNRNNTGGTIYKGQ
jgi:gas vesicle protein